MTPQGGIAETTRSVQSRQESVSVVFPCLDEAASVGACVTEASDTLRHSGRQVEVIVVDNGSTDGSPEIAANAGARVVRESRRGYGNALRCGFANATGDVVVMADADMTYPLETIPELLRPIEGGKADMVLGSRLGDAGRGTMPFLHRYIGTPVLTWLTARACGRRVVRDSQSGFRAFRRDPVIGLELRGSGMELATEMLIRSARAGLRIREIDTGYRPRVGSSKLDTWADGWRHLMLVLMLAPDLLLIGPGAVLTLLGVVMMALTFISPGGIEVGSLRWQPVFFSGIALIVGVQSMLAGVVLAHDSSVTSASMERRFRFVGHPRFRRRCFAAGLSMIAAGIAINVVLIALWVSGEPSGTAQGLGPTSLAQSLVVVGATLTTFSVVAHLQLRRSP